MGSMGSLYLMYKLNNRKIEEKTKKEMMNKCYRIIEMKDKENDNDNEKIKNKKKEILKYIGKEVV